MANRKIPINEATDAELQKFATEVLGMAIPPGTERATTLAKVQSAWDKPEIVVPGGDEDDGGLDDLPIGSAPVPVTAEQQGPKRGYVRLQIHPSEDEGGTDSVPVGVNGKVMLIPRGEPVDVPYPYFEALSRAVMFRYDSLPDGGISSIPREVALYPYQIMGGLQEAEADLKAALEKANAA